MKKIIEVLPERSELDFKNLD